MKRKSRRVNRLSPNEEAQLVQEELQRRRKLRLQQVREQERYIALQVRREVQERKEKELQNLALALQEEWQQQKGQRIQTLEQLYKENLQDVGQAHRSATQNEPNWEALAMKREENEERAAQRHQKALRELTSQRQAEKEQRNRPVEARKKALKAERERAAKIASLPQPAPNPVESIRIQTPLPPKMPSVQHYSITHHHHILESAVDREPNIEQPDAEQAAALEAQRVEELEREEVRDRREQLEKARLRGDNALRKERVIQDRAKLLSELGRLQQADLRRRRHLLNHVPAQIFQPLYRHDDLRNEQQRELEIAFQDLCTEEKELKGDLVLAFESEPLPLPVPSITSHSGPESDLDLDLSFDPNGTPCEEAEEEPAASSIQPIGSPQPVGGTSRVALRRLLERIRTQRDQWSRQNPPEVQAVMENTSTETGSLNDREWQQASSLEEGTADTSMPETSSKVNEDSIVAESMQQPEEQTEEQFAETDRRVMAEDLKSQQQEQLALLLELSENQRSLELQLEEAQQHRQRLQDMLQVQSRMRTEREEPNQPQDLIPNRLAEVKASAPLADSTHAQRLQEYQQRLLKQNRLHRQSIQDAFRRLEEYKQMLKLRHAAVSLNEETSCPFPSLADRTLATTRAGVPIPHETPVENTKRSYQTTAMKCADTPVIQPPLHSPIAALTTHSDLPNTHISESSCSQSEPPPQISSLRIERPISASEEEPLPPPSVILERLLSGRSAAHTQPRVPLMSRPLLNPAQISEDPGFVSQDEVMKTRPGRDSQVERNQQVREQIRKQRDALQALLRAEREKEESSSLETQATQLTPIDAQPKAFEKMTTVLPDAPSPSQSHSHTCPSLPRELCESMSGSRLKQPVSCQARPLHILLQDLEQHKLSTIQEVDTPANVTLDTAAEAWMERSSCSDCSSSSGTPIVGSNSSRGLSAASEIITSESGTAHGRASRLSWREMLQLESAASHAGAGVTEKRVIEPELVLPHGVEHSVEPDYLSSTTLSTGTYSTSEHDPNCTITDSSLCSNESARRAAAFLTCSSSLYDCELPRPRSSTQYSGSLQHIIEKYTKDMDQSLRTVLSAGNGSVLTAGRTGNTALSSSPERDAHAGALTAPQHLLESRNSLSTTMHDTFQPLYPEMTNNETADSSMNFHLPVNEGTSSPLLDDSIAHTHTASSEWLDCGLPAHSFSTDDQSATRSMETEMDTSLWKWILRTESPSSLQQRNSGLNCPEASLS